MVTPVAGASMSSGGPSVRAGVTRAVTIAAWSVAIRVWAPG